MAKPDEASGKVGVVMATTIDCLCEDQTPARQESDENGEDQVRSVVVANSAMPSEKSTSAKNPRRSRARSVDAKT